MHPLSKDSSSTLSAGHAAGFSHDLERFYASSQDLHCVVGSGGCFIQVSPSWQTMLGYYEHELIGRQYRDLIHPDDRHETQAQLEKTASGFETRKYENRVKCPDGNYRWFQWITVHDTHRQLYYSSARDITQMKALTYRLDAQASAINVSQAVVEFRLDGTIITANQRFLSLMGYELDEVVGKHHRMFVVDDYANSGKYIKFWQALGRGEFQSAEFKRLTKYGKTVWLQATYTPILGPDGKAERVIKFATDITERKRLNQQLDAQVMAVNKTQAVIEFDTDGTILSANQRFLDIMGFEFHEIEGRHHRIFVDAEEAESPGYASFWQALSRGEFQTAEFRRIAKDGRALWMQATYTPVPGPDGKIDRIIKFASDITERKKLHYRMDAQLKAINASQAVIEFNLDGQILTANQRFLNLMGYRLEELCGQHHRMFVEPEYAASEQYRQFWDSLKHGEFQSAEFRRLNRLGQPVWMQATYIPVLGPDGNPERILKFANDITAEKQAEHELMVAAQTDKLTGLANRAMITRRLSEVVDQHRTDPGLKYALLFLDFDRFKLINDTLGHDIGDLLLIQIADRLRNCIEQDGRGPLRITPARLGGDEFVVLLENLGNSEEANRFAAHLLNEFNEPYTLKGQKVFSTASIGVAESGPNPQSAAEMLRDADTAMYEAKTSGKNRSVVFSPLMRKRLETRVQLERDLYQAIQDQQLMLLYQPIASMESGEIEGAEALVRWVHPTRGVIPPNDFIPIAEECGMILPMGEWVLRESCRQFKRWRSMYPDHPIKSISVNLSRVQLAAPDLPRQIERIFNEMGIDPGHVRLEITESTVMNDVNAAKQIIQRLRSLGAKIVMDDFGTGYSSLGCLHEFSFDGLKIDRSFVNKIDTNRSIAALVHTITSLASNLGASVVAEGVETMSQFTTLQALECQYVQGYLLGKPMSAEDLILAPSLNARNKHSAA